jgi:hypothetical protein
LTNNVQTIGSLEGSRRLKLIKVRQVSTHDYDRVNNEMVGRRSSATKVSTGERRRDINKEYWGGIHQIFPQFFYDYSFYNSSPSQSGCTKLFHTRKNCGQIVEKL